MIRRSIYFLLATVLLGGLAAAIGYYAFDFKPKMLATVILGAPIPPETVAAEAARNDARQPQISGIGTLTASEGIDITPQVGGVVKDLNFESGQAIKKGALIIKLDTATEEAEMRSLDVQLGNANTELKRKEGLSAKGISPRADLDGLRTTRDTLQASIDKLRAQIGQKSILAPWDGRLGLSSISVGSYVAPGQKIVWLQQTDPIYADFTVTEGDYGRVKQGLKVTANFNAWPGQAFEGEILATEGRMSDSNRTLTVRAKLNNADGRLLPGMYANLQVDSGTPETILTVPQTAVTFSLYGDNVFVVVPATKLDPKAKPEELAIERRFVKLGAIQNGRAQIIDGIKLGEQVVTAGQNKIDQGSKVVINNSIALKANDSLTVQ